MAMAHVETRLRRGQIDPTEFRLEYAHYIHPRGRGCRVTPRPACG
jgi:hypothetical protein